MKARTDKQRVASTLNWDKMQLVSAVGHLKLLIAKYGNDFGDQNQLEYIDASVRMGMDDIARSNKIKGDYTAQVPYEESRMFKRNAKKFDEARKIDEEIKS